MVVIWNCVFKAPNAVLGQEWLNSVESGWTPASLLQSLVVTNIMLNAAKTKELCLWTLSYKDPDERHPWSVLADGKQQR